MDYLNTNIGMMKDKEHSSLNIENNEEKLEKKKRNDTSETKGNIIKSPPKDGCLASDSDRSSEKSPKKKKKHICKEKKLTSLEKLYLFMENYRNESRKVNGKNLPWTHAMTYEPFGAYYIPEDVYPKFLRLYEDAIVDGYQPHITEKHKEFGPIVIDFDFEQDKEHGKRYYTEKTILNIVRLYNKIMKKYLDVNNIHLMAYVLEKAAPTLRSNKYHDGIHLIYPYVCTKPSLQMLLREEFLKIAKKEQIFGHMPLINDLDSVFDKQVIYHSGWMLYGSRKNVTSQAYQVTHIYHTSNGKIYDTLVPRENIKTRPFIHHFVNILSCRRFQRADQMTPLADHIDPNILDDKINTMKEKIIENSGRKQEITALMGEDTNFIKAVEENVLVEAKNLVKLLSKQRATSYQSWYQVGKCLHNIDYRLLNDWIAFSKKCPEKFKIGECEKLWKKMKPSNYTMATLHYFARQDSPNKYLKMKEEKLNKLIRDGLQASHHAIAKILMEKYKYIYRCASIKHDIWYEFKNHRWIAVDSAYTLRNLISAELTQEYAKYQSYLYEVHRQKDEGYEKDKTMDEVGYVTKLIRKLNDTGFKNGVIKECAYLSYDPNFLKNLDENIYLICFENGVYDLESNCFRDGCPDDCISLCTGYDYVEYDENDATVAEINDFLSKIQTDEEMREYLMTLLSTCLSGSISEESFYVLTGSGANGKSKLMELLRHALGDYFKPMDIRVLTEKRSSSSSASPEVADKKGIRVCPFDEPEATAEMNTGFMKLFTGGEQIVARALYSEPVYFKPQFKPFLLCNHLPNIKSDDGGTWRRLKVIPFLSKFFRPFEITKKMKKEGFGPNQFRADDKLSEKLPEWKQTFMGMLLKYYQKYKKEGLVHPQLVTQYTEEYRKRCDVYQGFIGDYLEKTGNSQDVISAIKLHENMRVWYRSNYDGKCPSTKDLRNYLQNRIDSYNPRTDLLTGYRIKTADNEEVINELNIIG